MAKVSNIQELFFEEVKSKLPSTTSLVEEVAELLNVSSDSAYRRLRLNTLLTFQEVSILASHFNISVDKYLNTTEKMASFSYKTLNEISYDFLEYLKSILSDLRTLNSSNQAEIIYFAVDIPLPQLLFVPEMALFKLFFWEKTILNFESLSKAKFEFYVGNEEVNNISREIRNLYIQTPSIEVYSPDTINTTLKQIKYYVEAGYFSSPKIALVLCDKLSELVECIREQAAEGKKSHPRKPEISGDYKLYFNEVIYSDTAILAETENLKFSYLANNGLRRIVTHNEHFYNESKDSFNKLLKKASLLSGSSEKERNMVFNRYQNAISDFKHSILT